jgi:FkbM family methyltransferase
LLGYDRPRMDLYFQQPEVRLLAALMSRLDDRSVIDVGAERGAFVESLLRGGSTEIHAIEPEPHNVDVLRRHFKDESRVFVHEYAITSTDGAVNLHKSVRPSGEALPYGHTLLERPDADEIAWRETISVTGRSLASLMATSEIPPRVGILKVDTEGSDLAVISGMGELVCDVVMIEHWSDLPHSLGRCPWTIEDVTSILLPRGFSQFAFLEHRGDFAVLKWNDATVGTGLMGNVVFLHDRVLAALMPVLFECALSIAEASVEVGERYAAAAHARLDVIEQLERERPQQTDSETPKSRWSPRARLRFWTRPRIGTLHHYDPRRLTVPAKYVVTRLPTPAPTISIVIPSYQQGRYLARTLYSVVSQKYPALEFVIQDGGSSDETVDVIRRFEPALSLWRSEPDDGQGDAINRGFRETTGEIMAWLNADDLLLPGSLAFVASYFAAHPEVDVIYGNRIMIDEHDGQIGTWVLPSHDDRVLALADYVPQETLFWRRRIWEAAGGYVDPRFSYALDWDLLIRLHSAGAKMVRLPRFLGAFRVHAAQKTTADSSTGTIECDLIRRRLHGRSMSGREIFQEMKVYLVKHMLVDMRQRFIDRLHIRRVAVHTVPTDEDLRRSITFDRALRLTSHAELLAAEATSVEGVSSPR